jgi:hypothetical protein
MMQGDRKGFRNLKNLLLPHAEPFSFSRHRICNKEKVTN